MDEQSFEINRVKRFEYSCDSIPIHARNHDSLLMCKFVQRYNSLVSFIETVKRWSIEYSIDKCLPLIFLTLSPASDIDFTNQFLNYNLVGTQDKHFWGEWKECTSRQRIEIVAELIRLNRSRRCSPLGAENRRRRSVSVSTMFNEFWHGSGPFKFRSWNYHEAKVNSRIRYIGRRRRRF